MEIRRAIAAAGGALAVTSFAGHLILFEQYHVTRPTHPDPVSGLIYVSNSHGHYVYLSAAETIGLSLLMYLFMVGSAVAVIAIPKTFRIQPSAPYQPVGPVKWRLDSEQPATPLTVTVFFGAAAITAALIYLVGPWVADVVASSGIVLRFMS
ncbi:hypothetical protein [Inquilinus sp. CA228]|uniref:hypothetical protein n=1 Tax=Inquilinus sp. CA228 TaxID=3455609 RepID=UPI003F8D4B1E